MKFEKGNRPPQLGQGKGIKLLRSLLLDAPVECVLWPLFRDTNGYGRVGFEGKIYWAHRLMCTMANGEPPGPEYEAAHSCGRGNDGCVNPRHLSWSTRTRNQLDRASHGRKNNAYWGVKGKLTQTEVDEIRSLRGQLTQREIASRFSIADTTVRNIFSGKTWAPGRRQYRVFTPSEIAEMCDLAGDMSKLAAKFGVTKRTVSRVRAGLTTR